MVQCTEGRFQSATANRESRCSVAAVNMFVSYRLLHPVLANAKDKKLAFVQKPWISNLKGLL